VRDLLAAYDLGETGRTEIADLTGMTVEQVTQARRRLATLVKNLPAELRSTAADVLGSRR